MWTWSAFLIVTVFYLLVAGLLVFVGMPPAKGLTGMKRTLQLAQDHQERAAARDPVPATAPAPASAGQIGRATATRSSTVRAMSDPDESLVQDRGSVDPPAVHAGGTRFHVVEAGKGPLVLLLHGFPQFWWTWRNQLVSLAAAGYRAVAVDLRGYGASDKPPRGYDLLTLAADAAGLVRALGETNADRRRPRLGRAARLDDGRDDPKVVQRLVAVSAPHPLPAPRRAAHRTVRPAQGQPLRAGLPAAAATRAPADRQRRRAWWDGCWTSGRGPAGRRRTWRRPTATRSASPTSRTARWSTTAGRPAPSSARTGSATPGPCAPPINAPTLQLHGALDRHVLPRTAQGSGRYVAAPYRWRLIEGAGHFPHEERPEEFDAELIGWLADPEPDR